MTTGARLERLERNAPPARPAYGKCTWPNFTVILRDGETMPDNPPTCPQCGQPHILQIHQVLVRRAADGSLEEIPADELANNAREAVERSDETTEAAEIEQC